MLWIVIIVLIGKQFYQLAKKYKQKLAWIYFIVGVAAYYAGGVVTALFLLLYCEITGDYEIVDTMSDLTLTVISIASGVLSCWGAYHLLKNKWHKEYAAKELEKPKISDIGKSEDEIASEEF